MRPTSTSPATTEAFSGILTDPLRFPAIRAALQSGLFHQADDGDYDFEFGLSRILDGIELLMTANRASNVAEHTD